MSHIPISPEFVAKRQWIEKVAGIHREFSFNWVAFFIFLNIKLRCYDGCLSNKGLYSWHWHISKGLTRSLFFFPFFTSQISSWLELHVSANPSPWWSGCGHCLSPLSTSQGPGGLSYGWRPFRDAWEDDHNLPAFLFTSLTSAQCPDSHSTQHKYTNHKNTEKGRVSLVHLLIFLDFCV